MTTTEQGEQLEAIEEAVDNGHYHATGADGRAYMFGWDEQCTGIYVWPADVGEYDPALGCLCDDPEDAPPVILAFLENPAALLAAPTAEACHAE